MNTITRVVSVTSTHTIIGVWRTCRPRKLSAIVNGEIVTTEEKDSGMEFDHYEYVPHAQPAVAGKQESI